MSTSVFATHILRQNPDSTLYHLPVEIRLMILRWILVCAPLHDIVIAFDPALPIWRHHLEYQVQSLTAREGGSVHGHLACHTTLEMRCDCNPSRSRYSCFHAEVLRVCRRFYNEGIQMLYGANNFVFESFIQPNLDFLTRIGLSNTERLRSVRFFDPRNCEVPMDWKFPVLTWYSLRNLQKVEFIFSWNRAIDSCWGARSQDLYPSLRWCEIIESTLRKLAPQLHRMHRVGRETIEAWVAGSEECEPSMPESDVAVNFHVEPTNEVCKGSLTLEQANAGFWDDVQNAIRQGPRSGPSGGWIDETRLRWWTFYTRLQEAKNMSYLRPRDTPWVVRELFVLHWAHTLLNEKGEVHKDTFQSTKSLAAELARESAFYPKNHRQYEFSDRFVVSLEPTWKGSQI